MSETIYTKKTSKLKIFLIAELCYSALNIVQALVYYLGTALTLIIKLNFICTIVEMFSWAYSWISALYVFHWLSNKITRSEIDCRRVHFTSGVLCVINSIIFLLGVIVHGDAFYDKYVILLLLGIYAISKNKQKQREQLTSQ